jgi:hypothetical protein
MPPELIHLTRRELYDKVWTQPVRSIAVQLGVSDVALAKHCKRMKIPVPGRGYWAQVAARTNGKRIPLPALPPHDAVTPPEAVFQVAPVNPQRASGPVALQIAFEADPTNAIAVPETLRSAHPLVGATRDALQSTARRGVEFVGNRQMHHLDIDVTRGSLPRALRIMDALVKACEVRGWRVSLGTGDDRKSYVTIFEQRIPFGIRETLKKILNEPAKPQRLYDGTFCKPWHSKHRDEPTGRLAFIIRHSWGYSVDKSWVETPTRPLQERLSAFMISLVSAANEEVELHRRREQQRRATQEAEERRLLEQRRREAESARVRALHRQSIQWERSRRLRDYVVAVRAAAELQPGGLQAGSELADWLVWAEAQARSLDPLEQPFDNVLKIPPR